MSTKKICCLVLLVLGLLAIVVSVIVILAQPKCAPGSYLHAAVAADTEICSDIGRDILQRKGSAVDAAIAALVCTSVLNPQSMGLGGGVIFTIYNATTGEVMVINARETAPENINQDLLNQCNDFTLQIGSQWIAVPGELRGYEEAHRRYGRLPWKWLFEPTIQLLTHGIRMPAALSKFLSHPLLQSFLKKSSLCQLFCENGVVLKPDAIIFWPTLLKTLKAVAEKGAREFYEGEIAQNLVKDIKHENGNLMLSDLKNFQAEVMTPLNISLGGYTMYSPPPPAGGAVLLFILNILKEFKFTPESLEPANRKIETYHRIAEALKFGNGQKPKLDDPQFSGIQQVIIQELLSNSFAELVRKRIDDRGDHPRSFYNLSQPSNTGYGTSHVSVLAEDGSAVSVTSTINQPFGSMVYSPSTGIILNNELADFCKKKPKNKITSGERPPSDMVPSILISKDDNSKLVIGGSGGDLIISATALAIMNKLWFGYDLERAISLPVLHASMNNSIQFEPGFDEAVKGELLRRGHHEQKRTMFLNVVQGISKEGRCIFAYSDRRKLGKSSGY
ncbi:glutathione hydrolase 5 proenzyme isoform X1 [Gopherus flavomarginatus]|uniref:glutathione hydrolase 5 proenzyme isoform X1 n=2 Tax=Gopherus flavomarginatus TaxID=286002 RepID=UPI0021CBD6B9|nr:glutathione hydrolase 5 proenzyme isoform X1 [Gopherus flavomarginatus]